MLNLNQVIAQSELESSTLNEEQRIIAAVQTLKTVSCDDKLTEEAVDLYRNAMVMLIHDIDNGKEINL